MIEEPKKKEEPIKEPLRSIRSLIQRSTKNLKSSSSKGNAVLIYFKIIENSFFKLSNYSYFLAAKQFKLKRYLS